MRECYLFMELNEIDIFEIDRKIVFLRILKQIEWKNARR